MPRRLSGVWVSDDVTQHSHPCASFVILAGAELGGAGLHAAPIEVVVDQAKLAKLPDEVATIVIGNPLIADVALQPGGVMVITGKGYEPTNVVVLDRKGASCLIR